MDADLRKVHSYIASDLSLTELDMEYSEIVKLNIFSEKPLQKVLKILVRSQNYPILSIIFARIVAAKPHSADVERLISANNILKTPDRSSLALKTESLK